MQKQLIVALPKGHSSQIRAKHLEQTRDFSKASDRQINLEECNFKIWKVSIFLLLLQLVDLEFLWRDLAYNINRIKALKLLYSSVVS